MSAVKSEMGAEKQLLLAIKSAQNILARHVEPGGLNEKQTIDALLAVLDDQEVVEAVWDLNRKFAGTPGQAR